MDVSERRLEVAEIAAKRQLRLVLLFGSAVSGRTHGRSDIDIAVLFEEPPQNLRDWSELSWELQKTFPEGEVDLAVLNYADPLFLKKIVENCTLLWGNPRDLQELKIYAYKRYQDHKPYFQMENQYVERFLQEHGFDQ